MKTHGHSDRERNPTKRRLPVLFPGEPISTYMGAMTKFDWNDCNRMRLIFFPGATWVLGEDLSKMMALSQREFDLLYPTPGSGMPWYIRPIFWRPSDWAVRSPWTRFLRAQWPVMPRYVRLHIPVGNPLHNRKPMRLVKRAPKRGFVKQFVTRAVDKQLSKNEVVHEVARMTQQLELGVRVASDIPVKRGFPFLRRRLVRLRHDMFPAVLGKVFPVSPKVEDGNKASTSDGAEGSRNGGNDRRFHKHLSKWLIKGRTWLSRLRP